MSKTRVVATTKQKIEINEFLKTILLPIEGTDMFEYVGEWDDEKVAVTISANLKPELNRNHIATLRRELYGELKAQPKRSAGGGAASDEKLEEILAFQSTLQEQNELLHRENTEMAGQIAGLEARINALEGLHAKLIAHLTTKEQMDVAHLAGTGIHQLPRGKNVTPIGAANGNGAAKRN